MEKKLLDWGFKPITGLYFLAYAIELKLQNKFVKTCEIYKKAAAKFNSTPSRVERCIRHCIKTSNNQYKLWNNGEVISALAIEMEN